MSLIPEVPAQHLGSGGLSLGTRDQWVWGCLWGSGSLLQSWGALGAGWPTVSTPPPAHTQLLQWGPSDPVTMAASLQLEWRSRQTLL